MKTLRIFFFLAMALLSMAHTVNAQFQGNVYLEDSSIKVYANGIQHQLAWCGGFNNAQFSNADVDHDGKMDLVEFEVTGSGSSEFGTIKVFLNKGATGTANFVYAPKLALNFPPCNRYMLLVDYNSDGIADLFTKGPFGFEMHKGYYNSSNQLCFNAGVNLIVPSPIVGSYGAYVSPTDIPGIVDVDGDGDIDFFSFDANGVTISFYKNCAHELGLSPDSIRICLPSNCWGDVNQNIYQNYILGINSHLPFGTYCSAYGTFSSCKTTQHGGNTICMFDYEGDGDIDLLGGNVFFNSVQKLINGKAQYGGADSIIRQDSTWQQEVGGHVMNMPSFPSVFYVDVDGDGKRDVVVTPHASGNASISEDYKCNAWYKNTGTAAAPIFTYQNDSLLIDHSIDAGFASYPVLYDYNKDGLLDLFVGSEGYYQSNGTSRSKISYYQNVKVGGTTELVLQTTDFMGLFNQNFDGAAPAFGDIDGDGKDDMLIGHADGTISYYKNMAASNTVTPQWQLTQLAMLDNNNHVINEDQYASPFIYDINKDSKPDLLIGKVSDSISVYLNNSLSGTLKLQKSTGHLGNMTGNPYSQYDNYTSLYVGKMDNTGKDYIVMGNDLGSFRRYSGFQNGNTTTPYLLIDSIYSGINVGTRSTITIGDIDGDGKYEMIVGNQLGGLQLFHQALNVVDTNPVTGIGNVNPSSHCMIYPNPATTAIYITWDNQFAPSGNVNIQLMDVLGRKVSEQTVNNNSPVATIQVSGMASGVYMCIVHSDAVTLTTKISIGQ